MLQPTRPALPAVFSGQRTVNASHLLDGGGSNCGVAEGFQQEEIEELLNWGMRSFNSGLNTKSHKGWLKGTQRMRARDS